MHLLRLYRLVASIHDSFFKFVFARPDRARELLSLTLPSKTLHDLNLGPLRPVKGSFIPSELRGTSGDLPFQASRRSSPTEQPELFVYLRFEHKSSADPSTLLQLLGLSVITRSAFSALRYSFERRETLLRAALPYQITDSPPGELLNYFQGLITYLLRISPPEEESAKLKIVGTPAAREVVVTIAEKYINEGRAEGTLADRRGVLIRQLEKKFGLNKKERHRIDHTDDLERLAAALDKILFAQSKQQVLDKLS